MSTDRDWEKWGATDPYFGVLSCAPYRKSQLDTKALESFFRTGEMHVERVLHLVEHHFQTTPRMQRTLDYGCGVGRVAIPLASRSTECVAVDVSPSMLAEASRNAGRAGLTRIEFIQSNGDLGKITPGFDLVHSYIVLQHITWRRGRDIVTQLAEKVGADGFLVIQFLTGSRASAMHRAFLAVRYAIPPVNWVRNLVRQRQIFEPPMQLHVYDERWILDELKSRGFDRIVTCADPSVGEFSSILILAQRGFAPAFA